MNSIAGQKKALNSTFIILCLLLLSTSLYAIKPSTIPAVQEWADSTGTYTYTSNSVIVVDSVYQSRLKATATTFAEDLYYLTYEKNKSTAFMPKVKAAKNPSTGDIFLTIDTTDKQLGAEGYALIIGSKITVIAPNDTGLFWGTRTVLQLFKQKSALPFVQNAGKARDWPLFKERGLMVDLGRKWFPTSWLFKHIRDLSYMKYNIFHLHFSDHFGFRLPSQKHPEIVSPSHYTKEQIDTLLLLAKKYHLDIIPEIDMPGHTTYMLLKHPELSTPNGTNQDMHIGKDTTYKFVKEIIEEFIPMFPSRFWHVGADEYSADQLNSDPSFLSYAKSKYGSNANASDCYHGFINWVNQLVRSKGKTLRAWKDGLSSTAAVKIDTNIVVEHWYKAFGPSVQTFLDKRQPLINCHFTRLYYVLKGNWNLNASDLYENWEPYMLEGNDPVSNPHDPSLTGAKAHIWCDDSGQQNVETIANNIMPGLRSVAQKTWDSPKPVSSYTLFSPMITAIGRAPGYAVLPELPVSIDKRKSIPLYNNLEVLFSIKAVNTKMISVSIPIQGKHNVEIYAVSGRRIIQYSIQGSISHCFALPCTGIYLIKVDVNGNKKYSRMFVH